MEKAKGVSLDQLFDKMNVKDRFAIIRTVAQYQLQWLKRPFSGYGSLYFSSDLEDSEKLSPAVADGYKVRDDGKFAIGPAVGRQWLDNGRLLVDTHRGPCKLSSPFLNLEVLSCAGTRSEDYLAAVAHREIACVREMSPLPKSFLTLFGPATYQPSHEKKTRALQFYLKLINTLLLSDESLLQPCLWHADLHIENIFVDPANPTHITSIIDWQSTEVMPLFLQFRQPFFIDFEGPQPEGLERPRLPPDLKSQTQEEQHASRQMYLKQSLVSLYRTFMHKSSSMSRLCLEFQDTPHYLFILLAPHLRLDGEATFMAQILDLAENGDDKPENVKLRDACKYISHSLSADEKNEIQSDLEGSLRGIELMKELKEEMGDLFPERGIVRTENYDAAKSVLAQAKKQIIDDFAKNEEERAAWEMAWPFDT